MVEKETLRGLVATLIPSLLALTALAPTALAADPGAVNFVACAPGYPGTTAEAQSTMDGLAGAIADASGWARTQVAMVYHENEKAGVARIQADGAVVMIPLPFYLEHGDALKLTPRLGAVMQNAQPTETWTLMAKKGAVTSAASLDGWQIISLAAFSPRFVKNVALAGWGPLPESVKLSQSGQVLSALRKAVKGDKVAVLLDSTQAAAISSLPFAGELEVVRRSQPLPSNLVATVGDRVPDARWQVLSQALLGLTKTPAGTAALTAARMTRFVALDAAALASSKKLFAGLSP